jgi:hypothetical protein
MIVQYTHALDSQALVVRGNGPRRDSLHIRVLLLLLMQAPAAVQKRHSSDSSSSSSKVNAAKGSIFL